VFLPTDLRPLPATPSDGGAARCVEDGSEDFVRADDVREVLLGGAGELGVAGLSSFDFEYFSGRQGLRGLPGTSRSSGFETSMASPGPEAEPVLLHPAFEELPAVKRATPPEPRMVADFEATLGRAKMSDRWWVIGMGAAAAAILFSGMAVDFISREAVRRSLSAVEPVSHTTRPVPAETTASEEKRSDEIAASLRPVEESR
jgi:hypothetical protein